MLQISFWKNRRVLVTGHTGFKGSWLVLWLLSLGAEVWGLSLDSESEESLLKSFDLSGQQVGNLPGKLNHFVGDIRDFLTCKKLIDASRPQVVIHLAAQALVRRSYIDPLETWSTNVQGSLNILEALKSLSEPCAVVMITTDKVYQNNGGIMATVNSIQSWWEDPYSAAGCRASDFQRRSSFCGLPNIRISPYIAQPEPKTLLVVEIGQ